MLQNWDLKTGLWLKLLIRDLDIRKCGGYKN